LRKIWLTWASTVLGLRNSLVQMPWLEWALGHQGEDLPLAVGELGERAAVTSARHQPRHDGRVNDAFALGDPSDRVGRHRDVGYPLLERIADTHRR